MYEDILKESIRQGLKAKNLRKRFLYDKIKKYISNFLKGREPRILLISGLRGTGKTTLLRQVLLDFKDSVYLSADSFLLKKTSLYEIVLMLSEKGKRMILIDEIHSYSNWIKELKNIYDSLDVFVIATGSSISAINLGEISLGRRAISLRLDPLTFKEFVYLKAGIRYSSTLKDVLDLEKAYLWIAEKRIPPLEEYLKYGGFPIYLGAIEVEKLLANNIKRMLYRDALATYRLNEEKIDLMERLLVFIALSGAGEFSIESFTKNFSVGKSSVYNAINLLMDLNLIIKVREPHVKGQLRETYKLLFSHPNLRVAVLEGLSERINPSPLKEEYFVFHTKNYGFKINIPKKGRKNPDYIVDIKGRKYVFEIGGKSKGKRQIKDLKNAFVLKEENLIPYGFLTK